MCGDCAVSKSGKLIAAAVGLLGLMLMGLVLLVVLLMAVLAQDASDSAEDSTCRSTAEAEGGGKIRIPAKWVEDVEDAADESGVPTDIIGAQLEAESQWNEKASNPSGAAGMAQAMPGTWSMYGEGDPMNGHDAIRFQGKYMRALMDEAKKHSKGGNDQVEKALAAYNWGPGNMDSVGWDWSKGPAETREYVPKIMRDAQVKVSADCSAASVDNLGDLGDGEWANPLPGSTLVSGYGPRSVGGPAWAQQHVGIDLATDPTVTKRGPGGTTVAVADAKVERASCTTDVTMGCEVLLRFDKTGFMASYNHMDSIDPKVKAGGHVLRGQKIGVEGNKGGWDFGTHLHFEMYKPTAPDSVFPYQGWNVDPEPLLKQKGAM